MQEGGLTIEVLPDVHDCGGEHRLHRHRRPPDTECNCDQVEIPEKKRNARDLNLVTVALGIRETDNTADACANGALRHSRPRLAGFQQSSRRHRFPHTAPEADNPRHGFLYEHFLAVDIHRQRAAAFVFFISNPSAAC